MKRPHLRFMSTLLTLALASPMLLFAGTSPQSALTGIQVSFKLDPRLMSGVYGGERWVSPPTYVGANAQDTVEVRALGVDAKGKPIRISPQWIPSDPEMVTVSPGQGDAVKITVKRAGESKLQVTTQGVSNELEIKAASRNNILQFEIAQREAKPPASAPAQDSPAFKSPKEKLSYAVGMNLAAALQKQSVGVDEGLVIQGFRDALSGGKTLMTEQEVRAALLEKQNELKSKQAASQAEQSRELAAKNKKDGEDFLAGNKKKDGVVTLPSGLQYKIIQAGQGQKPKADEAVVCNYRGTLIDGTEFDSSYKRKGPVTLPLQGLIKGWGEALQLMPAGSKWQLFIPANLAYGERGAPRGNIGPNSTLIFEVEMLSIQAAGGQESGNARAASNLPPQ